MNSESGGAPRTVSNTVGPAETSASDVPTHQKMYWLLQRELWENRSIYLAPLAVAGLLVIGCVIGLIHLLVSGPLPGSMRGWNVSSLDPYLIQQPLNLVALLIMATTVLVTFFYCLDALHSERSDRSILFWKSLPVSDLATVLSKLATVLIVLPLVCFAIVYATQILLLILTSAVLLVHGQSVAPFWTRLSLLQAPLMVLYHLVTMHVLWYAPIYGWLLLVSAWARRAPLLWAVLPPLAIGFFEKIAFSTSYFKTMLLDRLGADPAGGSLAIHLAPMDPLMQVTPGHFLLSPGLWIGFAVAAAFLAAAIRVRHYRGPI